MLLCVERTAHMEVRTPRKALLVPTGVGHVLRDAVASLPPRPPPTAAVPCLYYLSLFILYRKQFDRDTAHFPRVLR